MARIESLNVLTTEDGKAYLAEEYGKVIENVQKNTISSNMKNKDLSGDPTAGTVEAKRFANATSQDYGSARAAGAGNAVKADPVTVAIDTDKEIVEEVEQKDVSLLGVEGWMARRASNHTLRMTSELDTQFFATAAEEGTAVTITDTAIEDIVEALIQQCENTQNDFVDGVDRALMHLVCNTSIYGKLRTYLDKVTEPTVDAGEETFYRYHGVKTYSTVHLPSTVDAILMVDGAVAQPVMSDQYAAEKIPLSNAYGIELFYHYGTKAVTPDLIFTYTAA
ncbi:MAG: hypothetical protein LUC83_10090 [Clostridiales bacterium]|nr:hypothetical protein [Clostridiales bacterium]